MSERVLMLSLVALFASALVAGFSAAGVSPNRELRIEASGVFVGTTPDRTIRQRSIGGARLGLPRRAYVAIFGRPFRVGQLEGGFTLLFFTRLRVEVFLRSGEGVAINTFGRAFRTRAGVGPCSPVRALRGAYGDRLRKLPTSGPVSLYRLGNLVFRVADRQVGAVALGRGRLEVFFAGNSADCGGR